MLFTSSRIPQSAKKFPLGHSGLVELGVAADIFYTDGHLYKVTHATNIAGGFSGNRSRVGHGQKIMSVAAIDASPAKMIGQPRRLSAFHQGLELFEMLAVRAICGAEIHRDSVLDHTVLLENLVEHLQRSSTVAHEVFRDNLKPVDHGLLLQNVPVVRYAKTNTDTVIGEIIEWIGRHNPLRFEKRESSRTRFVS
jgi:hypothetical protein